MNHEQNPNLKETSLQITGMTCAACANRIERGLKKMPGVESANVNLALEKSTIHYDPDKISVKELEKKIEDLGYGVVKEKKELVITGMTCAACANRIEKGLNKMLAFQTRPSTLLWKMRRSNSILPKSAFQI